MALRKLDPTSSPLEALAVQISRARLAKGLTQIELGKRIGYTNVYISNVERAKQAPSLKFVERVDAALDAGGALTGLWWSWKNGVLLPGFSEYLRKEREAITARLFDTDMVSGILQHPDYSAAYEAGIVRRGEATREQADRRLGLLTQRQQMLDRGTTIHAVLDEGALRRPIGGREIMVIQLAHLERLSDRSNVIIQVAPYRLAEDRPLTHPVTLLTLPNRALVGYTETLQRGYMEQDVETVARWVDRYDRLQVNALSQPDSLALIREARKELDHA
ncbi:helix-turn-helix domain-containing protein [Kitasatospora brasiliensis]|uniref:helix-turn-helix domain-containing protein n=1 Tax=Kitasatospora brasiliensis TaxID=3058040 RepID=UPI0029301545|nr:helix-turn-helix transcriptional regulator [Kitasatospora sp. K002]